MNLWEVVLIFTFLLLLLIYSWVVRRKGPRTLRPIRAFDELRKTIELSVEDGSRLQVSLGRGGILGPQSAAALVGLSLLREVTRTASDSDQPPIATTGEGVLALLAQDTIRRGYQDQNIGEQYHTRLARITGLTPMSYAAGTMPLLLDRLVSSSALIGNFGEEVGLITAASRRGTAFSLGASDNLSAQSILFASADEPLIGEELYATGAYMQTGTTHHASLHAQDILRWLIILAIAGLALSSLVGAVL